jgi:hypothetical protein
MNVFTIHMAVAAMIGLLAFYPVFGRPRTGAREVTSDFGEHVQAVGEMLRGTRDSGYAKRTIAKYFRVVRGDTVSGWSTLDRSVTEATVEREISTTRARTILTPAPLKTPSSQRKDK